MAKSLRSRQGPRSVQYLLSPFQLEVASLCRHGFGRNAVAAALGVSPGTVKVVLREIRLKLGPDWQRNPEYVWPEDTPRPPAEGPAMPAEPPAGRADGEEDVWRFAAESLSATTVPNWRRLEFTGLQRFWLKPALDRLVEEGALRLSSAGKEEVFAPPWLSLVHSRRRVRPAVYRVRDPVTAFRELAGFLEVGLPGRAAEVMERIEAARGLLGPWRKPELPGREEICALLREAFGEAGERAAAKLKELTVLGEAGSRTGEKAEKW